MNKDQITIYMNSESGQDRSGYNGFKIIEVNVSSSPGKYLCGVHSC